MERSSRLAGEAEPERQGSELLEFPFSFLGPSLGAGEADILNKPGSADKHCTEKTWLFSQRPKERAAKQERSLQMELPFPNQEP